MKRIALKMDSKGRIQIPKSIRQELDIHEEIIATVENGAMKIEPVENILDKLSKSIRFKYGSVESSLPALRKAAAKQMLKEISR
jgi:AbrB family looped-hinge helix DNA binding protein